MSWRSTLFSLLLLVVIALFLFGGVQQRPDVDTPSKDTVAFQDFKARLVVEAPLSTASVTVMDEGVIRYEADAGGETESKMVSISQLRAIELKELILSSGFMQLNPSYAGKGRGAAVKHAVEVQFGNAMKRVECSDGCPLEFKQVEDKIRELWGREIVEIGA